MFRQAVRKFSTEAASNAKYNTVGMERFVPLTVAAEPCSLAPKRNILTGKWEVNGWPVLPSLFLGYLVYNWNEQRIQQKAGLELTPFVAGATSSLLFPFWTLYRTRTLHPVLDTFTKDVKRAAIDAPAVRTVSGNIDEIQAMVHARGGVVTQQEFEDAKERVPQVLSV
eukprot:UN02771